MWIPDDTKITDFGKYWRANQYIPELTDAVKGEAIPAVATTFAALNSASARVFAEIENNLAYLDRIMIFKDVTIAVASVAQLLDLNKALEKVSYIHKGATIAINIAAGTYVWTDTTYAPIQIHDIHGGGAIEINGGFTIQVNALPAVTAPVAIKNNTVTIKHSGGTLTVANNIGTLTNAFYIYKNKMVRLGNIEIKCLSTNVIINGVKVSHTEYCELASITANTLNGAGVNVGIGVLVYSTYYSSVQIGAVVITKLTSSIYEIAVSSEIILTELASSIPTGANMATLSGDVVNLDDTSQLKAIAISSSGAGTLASPYAVTVANEGNEHTARFIENLIASLPKPLDVHVKLNLPGVAIARTTANEVVSMSELHGSGSLTLKGAGGSGTGLTTILNTPSNEDAIRIDRCSLNVIVDLIASGSNSTTGGFVTVVSSPDVKLKNCYADTGAGSAIVATRSGTHLYVEGCTVGAFTSDGLSASDGAEITSVNNVAEGGGAAPWPARYGNRAQTGGQIYRDVSSGTFVKGAVATDSETTGGKVFSS